MAPGSCRYLPLTPGRPKAAAAALAALAALVEMWTVDFGEPWLNKNVKQKKCFSCPEVDLPVHRNWNEALISCICGIFKCTIHHFMIIIVSHLRNNFTPNLCCPTHFKLLILHYFGYWLFNNLFIFLPKLKYLNLTHWFKCDIAKILNISFHRFLFWNNPNKWCILNSVYSRKCDGDDAFSSSGQLSLKKRKK